MTLDLRVLHRSDLDAWFGVLGTAFGGALQAPEERDKWRALCEPARSIGAWDGSEAVGTAGAFSFRMTVPGGAAVPTAGVTMVSVKPTHRRRGILRAMMRRQLDDVRSWGEPLAVLTASEPVIYGRFGYGVAAEQLTARVDTAVMRPVLPQGADALRIRLVDPLAPEVRRACEELYARRVPLRPGMLERRPGWERVPVHDPESSREGASPMYCALAERDGELRGYVRYAVRPDWDAAGSPAGEVLLRDLEALDPAAHGALYDYLFGLDLTSRLRIGNRPVDDPLLHLVPDVRRCEVRVRDGLHLRLVDVGAALSARAYAAPVDVVLEVSDPFCPWNEGRWRLSGGPGGASCERTRDEAELALSVRELAAAFLGGTSLSALAAAGRVRELRPGALTETAVAFRGEVAPWLPHGF
ncbi:GNAT family N-acetyltransferase [Streptomyces sp. JJ36]|uniref:GNAT family N-acetyltransferase n=1 Tax=Streptomyces sp. JJ36 TaxID=2736645 RepID=UPI001F4344EA|nr:GNAT family N-acetyltransferase [Streptomyces sp. JJ36]MCF6526018.1 GNAT family N-acetyltransferase [Streptomyces sp. JJ36]